MYQLRCQKLVFLRQALEIEVIGMNNVKCFRHKASLTQVQLAQACGVTRQTIYLIEVGKYNPTIALCQKICHALNTALNSLFGTNE